MKKAIRLLGILVAVAAGYYFLRQAIAAWNGADLAALLSWRLTAFFAAALLLYLLQVPLAALIWRWILRDMHIHLAPMPAYAVFASTQFGKYLPGNVAQHIGRVAVARSYGGGDVSRLTLSLIYENLIALLVGIHVTVTFLALRPAPLMERWLPLASKWLLLAIVTGGAALAFLLLPRLLAYVQRKRGLDASGGGFRLSPAKLSLAYGAFGLGFLLMGLAFTMLAHAVEPASGFPFLALCGAFAAAWVVGLLVPGAPAGLGVREGILLALLTGSIGSAAAIAAVALLRLVTTLGDLLHFLFGTWLLRTAFTARLREGGV